MHPGLYDQKIWHEDQGLHRFALHTLFFQRCLSGAMLWKVSEKGNFLLGEKSGGNFPCDPFSVSSPQDSLSASFCQMGGFEVKVGRTFPLFSMFSVILPDTIFSSVPSRKLANIYSTRVVSLDYTFANEAKFWAKEHKQISCHRSNRTTLPGVMITPPMAMDLVAALSRLILSARPAFSCFLGSAAGPKPMQKTVKDPWMQIALGKKHSKLPLVIGPNLTSTINIRMEAHYGMWKLAILASNNSWYVRWDSLQWTAANGSEGENFCWDWSWSHRSSAHPKRPE